MCRAFRGPDGLVIVRLNVRTFGDCKAQVAENGGDFVDHLRDWMDAAALGGRLCDGERHIDFFSDETGIDCGVAQVGFAGGQSLGDSLFQRVDGGSCGLAFIRRHGAERFQKLRDRAPFAQRCDAHCFNRRFVRSGGDIGEEAMFQSVEV
jgi:hypothetical protein